MPFLVKYRVMGLPQVHQVGPYPTREIANIHRDDIAGYERIRDVQVEEEAPEVKSAWERLLGG